MTTFPTRPECTVGQAPPPDQGYPLISAGVAELREAIAKLGLEQHVVDLDINGYTIVPDVLSVTEIAELGAELVEIAGMDEEEPVDLTAGASHRDRTQEVCMLFNRGGPTLRDRVGDPRTLTLIRYLLGSSCVLSSYTGYIKGPGRCALGVHADTAYMPDPLPPYAQVANVNLLLSDYTPEAGCLTMVPGSHRYCHRPREGFGGRETIPVVASAGSAVVFHGNTWHSALPRSEDGVRLTLSSLYSRLYMRTQENYAEAMTAEELAALPALLRSLVAPEMPTGWRSVAESRTMMTRRKDRDRVFYQTRGQHV